MTAKYKKIRRNILKNEITNDLQTLLISRSEIQQNILLARVQNNNILASQLTKSLKELQFSILEKFNTTS